MTECLNLKRIDRVYRVTVDLQLYRQMTGRHTPRSPQNILENSDNYLGLSGIYARVSMLMVGT